jgi:hypothetical protein
VAIIEQLFLYSHVELIAVNAALLKQLVGDKALSVRQEDGVADCIPK